ncbi:dihydrolipoyl dehydrogenase [Tepidiforma flava]|uniref:Dihydrolipoyl dehydrogenase n=1 Tax=Tepidiforma flava TaxID=3004094 RepID=A0ABY7M6Y4_9CHLR|nr:dihydrolipoyl dehydrogenase [Tepidiforma flava]WBL36254.1 dihydrolipoyl dehydrogenase [Tepidiforma flava]
MAQWDVAVIGGGPGGYVAAIRAAQLGLKTAVFEKERVGGLCLNWGCIPSKALLKNADVVNAVREGAQWGLTGAEAVRFDYGAAVDRSRRVVDQIVGGVEGLLRDNGVELIAAEARLTGTRTVAAGGAEHRAANIIIATGAGPRVLPGLEPDGETVITSREALARRDAPRRAVIIGAGPVGVEFAHLWASYGSEVTLIELMETLLPLEDPEIGRLLKRSFEARGIRCLVGTRVAGIERTSAGALVRTQAEGSASAIEAETVLVAVGFTPRTEGLGLEAAGVRTTRGFIEIDGRMATNVPGVYAVGDVTGKLMLAHVASQQGVLAAEAIAGLQRPEPDYVQMPRATFCQPQAGSIGYTEAGARQAGFEVKTGRFPLTALGKAVAAGHTEGFVKVVVDAATGQVLGIHMVGHDINDLLGEATMVAMLEATTAELGFAVHAHPTLPEALKEAALAADGEAIHIAKRRAAPREGAVTA